MQLFAVLGRFRPQEMLQPSLISLDLERGLSRRRSRVRVPSLPPFRSCRPAASIDRFRLQDPLEFKTSSKLRTIAASRGLGVAPRGVNLIGRQRSLAAGGGFACRLGAIATASPSDATSAPRLKAESKLIPPRDFLKGATGGSRLARNQVRAKRPATIEETLMHPRNLLLALAAGAIAVGFTLVSAQAQAPMALSGQVSSAADGPMEGVVVSAKTRRFDGRPSRSSATAPAGSASRHRSLRPAAIRLPFVPSAMTSKDRRTPTSPPAEPRPPTSSCGRPRTWPSSSPMRNGLRASPAPTRRRKRCSTASAATTSTAS